MYGLPTSVGFCVKYCAGVRRTLVLYEAERGSPNQKSVVRSEWAPLAPGFDCDSCRTSSAGFPDQCVRIDFIPELDGSERFGIEPELKSSSREIDLRFFDLTKDRHHSLGVCVRFC